MSETDPTEESIEEPTEWPDLAMGLYERLTGRGAEIIYEFDDMEVEVPTGTGEDAEHAAWHLNGSVTISTRERD